MYKNRFPKKFYVAQQNFEILSRSLVPIVQQRDVEEGSEKESSEYLSLVILVAAGIAPNPNLAGYETFWLRGFVNDRIIELARRETNIKL